MSPSTSTDGIAAEDFDTALRAGVAQLLATAGVGTWSPTTGFTSSQVAIVDGDLPPTPENAIGLMSYGVSDDPLLSDSVIGLQVQARAAGADPRATAKLSGKVFDELHGLTNVVLPGGVFLVQCYRQSWLSIGQDENNRWREKSNFYATVHRPSKYRV